MAVELRPGERDSATPGDRRVTAETVGIGAVFAALAGVVAVVTSGVGLFGGRPATMMAIATMAVGAALAAQGVAIAARYSSLIAAAAERRGIDGLGRGMTSEFFGGGAVLGLGIMALLGWAPLLACGIAVVVYGGSLILGSRATWEIAGVGRGADRERARLAARQAVRAASGTQLVVGAGGAALGLLSLVGLAPGLLLLIALLAYGLAVLLGAATTGTRVAQLWRH